MWESAIPSVKTLNPKIFTEDLVTLQPSIAMTVSQHQKLDIVSPRVFFTGSVMRANLHPFHLAHQR